MRKGLFAFIFAVLLISMFAYSLFGYEWSFNRILTKMENFESTFDATWVFEQVEHWKQEKNDAFDNVHWNYNLTGIIGFFLNIWNICFSIFKGLYSFFFMLSSTIVALCVYFVNMLYNSLRLVGIFFLPTFG